MNRLKLGRTSVAPAPPSIVRSASLRTGVTAAHPSCPATPSDGAELDKAPPAAGYRSAKIDGLLRTLGAFPIAV